MTSSFEVIPPTLSSTAVSALLGAFSCSFGASSTLSSLLVFALSAAVFESSDWGFLLASSCGASILSFLSLTVLS